MANENNSHNENGNNKSNSKQYHKHYRKKHNHSKKPASQPPAPTATDDTVKAVSPDNAQPRQNNQNNQNNQNGHPSNQNHKKRHKNHKNHKPNHPAAEKSVPTENNEAIIKEDTTATIDLGSDALDFYEAPVAAELPPKEDVVMVEIIGVRFKESGKTYYFAPNGITAKKGEYVIVDTSRGLEFGKVAVANSMVSESEFVPPLRPVVRIANAEDVKHHDENVAKQAEAEKICNEKIIAHKLDMKLIDVQYTFDNSKLLFYFTSSGRVDFRELVKDLASVFKTRIELRQIGIRDEAKLIGGLGICGRPLCCSVFLSDFGQVSIKMAKEQNLSLNSSKISGACGRLMCCLRYEYDTYVQETKNMPAIDSHVKTPDGNGTVTEIMPIAGKIKVRLDDKPDQPPRTYAKDNIAIIPKQKQ